MALTQQQQLVVDTIKKDDVHMLTVQACAGAGKTHTLVELVRALNPSSGIYLAYNKSVSEEAAAKFKGTNIKCSTIHSLAYNAVVRQYQLSVGYFGVRNVRPSSTPYRLKMEVVNTLDRFCLSKHLSVTTFFDEEHINPVLLPLVKEHLELMSQGDIQCSHSFYLKLYHIYLATGAIEVPEVDLLLVDECGDLSELTIDVFRLLKAKKKIAVGDPMQNIYSFNHTVNAFNVLTEGAAVNLTESFRVSDRIAYRIETFVRDSLDPSFEFLGRVYDDDVITTKAFISRGNTALLSEMLGLMKAGIPFHSTRKIGAMLELPLILANLGNGVPIEGFQYKHLEKLRKEYEEHEAIRDNYNSIQRYVEANVKEDKEVHNAFRLVHNHGPRSLNELTRYATECSKKACTLTLTTAHSSKGLEFSSVTIADDLNESVNEALGDLARLKEGSYRYESVLNKLEEELRLYYVATSRAMVELNNATALPDGDTL